MRLLHQGHTQLAFSGTLGTKEGAIKKGLGRCFNFCLGSFFDHFTLYQKKQPESTSTTILLLFYQWIGTNIPSMKQGFFCETKMYASERSHKALWSVSWVPLILGHPSFSQSFVLIYMHYTAFKSIDKMLRKQSVESKDIYFWYCTCIVLMISG